MDSATDTNDLIAPFYVIKTDIACPFHDGQRLPIEIGWVYAGGPVLHINAPDVIKHLQDEHGHR